MTSLNDLKETKIPKYTRGMSSADYRGKVLAAASSRSRARDAFEGVILNEVVAADAAVDNTQPGFLDRDEYEERLSENRRAYDDLLGAMSGRLITEVRKAKTTVFPEGCAATGFARALKKIKEITDGEEEDLLREFSELDVLEKGDDPREHFERLER